MRKVNIDGKEFKDIYAARSYLDSVEEEERMNRCNENIDLRLRSLAEFMLKKYKCYIMGEKRRVEFKDEILGNYVIEITIDYDFK